ncbi:GAF domain containing protein [Trichomonas vaginalis G3]|uniref:GAF domain containing protein n=1 Tax=Trichomonas vaginalis (strain ATCC PRA-98 / G3) TaxID=412133 RepID=A2G4P7_TRIV3|nr:3',5'-cyclic-nucleotide phosphodiesterase protein [Trichomonas vaginalis G3]EAX87868.1 GAF domain containing protein [Trichomonas vaginalis G3]KAI5547549.1 3',5'-cyclic-nucleotide phosphodiesterase protein [Trichomonas vaginalis G3]|eukprot:XP_001300798.1 GAF domain containing protein [Trichomonas vaginalis G3]
MTEEEEIGQQQYMIVYKDEQVPIEDPLLLSQASPYFKTLYQNNPLKLVIDDSSYSNHVFHLLLDACNNKLTHFYLDYIFDLYHMAKDWMVQSLVSRCEAYIKAQNLQELSKEIVVENLQKINPRKTTEADKTAIKNACANYEKLLTDPSHLIYLVNPNIIIQIVRMAENTDYNQELFAIMVSQLYNTDKDKALFLFKNYQWNLLSKEQYKGYFSMFETPPKETEKEKPKHKVKIQHTEQIAVQTEQTALTSRSKSRETRNTTKAKVLQALNISQKHKLVPPLSKTKKIEVFNRPIHRRAQSSMPIPSPTATSSLKAQPFLNPNDVDYRRKLVNRLNDEKFFDQMMDRCNVMTFDKAFEPLAKGYFEASKSIVWIYDFKEKFYYSRTLDSKISQNVSIFELVSSQKTVLRLPDISDEEQANQIQANTTDHQLFIPLFINNGMTIAILQITREKEMSPFSISDEEKASFFMRKFEIYGGSFFGPPMRLMMASSIAQISSPSKTVDNIIETIQKVIKAKTIEFWYYDNRSDEYAKFMPEYSNFTLLYRCSIGIVANCLKRCQDVNLPRCGTHANFSERADGDPSTPILVTTIQFDGKTWAMVMRERMDYDFFTSHDLQLCSSLMPFILRSIAFSTGFSQAPTTSNDNNDVIITRLLDASSDIASTLDLRDLIKRIEENITSLLNCQTARLLLSDTQKNEFHSDFGNDISEFKAFQITDGLASYVYSSKMTVLVEDPSKNEYYDKNIDAGDVEKVNNILGFPISGQGGIVLAVVLCLNKNKNCFNDNDVTTAQSFSNICGVALQNAIVHHRSISITSMLSEMDEDINFDSNDLKISDVQKLLDSISNKALKFTCLASSCLYLAIPSVNGIDVSLFKENGNDGNQYYEFAKESLTKTEYSVKIIEAVIPESPDKEHDSEPKTSSRSYLSSNRSSGNQKDVIKPLKTVVVGSPILDEEKPVGIFIFTAMSAATPEEIQMIKTFLSISLSKFGPSQIKSLSKMWDKKMHLRRYIKDDDNSPSVPQSLLISVKEIDYAATDTIDDAFKIVVSGFYHLGLISSYTISVSKILMLVLEISTRYPEGFRSFAHTLDTFKYLVRALKFEELMSTPKNKCLSMLLASLCCELDRPNFEELGEVALEAIAECNGICVDSGCNSLTEIIRVEECNILENIKEDEQRNIWKDTFRFAHATDLSRHFEIMDTLQQCLEEEDGFDSSKETHLNAMLDAVMKCADLHDVILPLNELEEKRYEFSRDFFMFGEILRCKGMFFDGEASRTTINQKESNLGFFMYICLPLFAAVGKSIAGFEPDVDNLLAAIAHFREQLENQASNETKEETKDSNETKEETKNSNETKEETKDSNETKEETKDSDETKEETKNSNETKEETKNSNETKEETKDSNETKEETKDSDETKEETKNSGENKEETKNSNEEIQSSNESNMDSKEIDNESKEESKDNDEIKENETDSNQNSNELKEISIENIKNEKNQNVSEIHSSENQNSQEDKEEPINSNKNSQEKLEDNETLDNNSVHIKDNDDSNKESNENQDKDEQNEEIKSDEDI